MTEEEKMALWMPRGMSASTTAGQATPSKAGSVESNHSTGYGCAFTLCRSTSELILQKPRASGPTGCSHHVVLSASKCRDPFGSVDAVFGGCDTESGQSSYRGQKGQLARHPVGHGRDRGGRIVVDCGQNGVLSELWPGFETSEEIKFEIA